MKNHTASKPLNKVANITIFFWIIKIISTTAGESTSDFLGEHLGTATFITLFLLLAGLIASVFIQIRYKRYVPWMYWTVIVLIAVFGTMLADTIHFVGVPFILTTSGFLVLLLAALAIWHRSENSLDMHTINTPRREIFYWAVIFLTFCFGTAAGDWVANGLHLGFLDAAIFFGVAMLAIPAVLYALGVNSIALFWISYILTRPFGAAGADLLGKPTKIGGFGLGDGTTSVISLIAIVVLVALLTVADRQEMRKEEHVYNQ
ncbi:COG4705 family protein [Vibrio marisflavi]|uniref:Membrane-anchored protein n=1 Tax=Vibrio marisflavi CECT 7928 TaxID=634439 RepID=A0ABN8DZE7_9VIBR|nr:hypothetical protein [Vibrio marisflavi]CAH0537123.1 hypothetical protein VMF7928_00950 [Vibrio marisflavi CECT 7928]